MGVAPLGAPALGKREDKGGTRRQRRPHPGEPGEQHDGGEAEEAPDPPGDHVAEHVQERRHAAPSVWPPSAGRRSSTAARRASARVLHQT